MEEIILVLKVACAGCAEVPRQIAVPRTTVPKHCPILETFQIQFLNLTKLGELEYEQGTVISQNNLGIIDIKNWHTCSPALPADSRG